MREQEVATSRRINSETSYIPGRRRCVSYYCTVGLRPKSSDIPSTLDENMVRARSSSFTSRASAVGTNDGASVISIQALGSYRSRLNLVRYNAAKGGYALHNARRPHTRNLAKIQLHFVPIDVDFNSHKTIVPGFGRLLDRILWSSGSRQGRRIF